MMDEAGERIKGEEVVEVGGLHRVADQAGHHQRREQNSQAYVEDTDGKPPRLPPSTAITNRLRDFGET